MRSSGRLPVRPLGRIKVAAGQGAVVATPLAQPVPSILDVPTAVGAGVPALAGVRHPSREGAPAVPADGGPAERGVTTRPTRRSASGATLTTSLAATKLEAPKAATAPTRVRAGTGTAAVAPVVGVGRVPDGAPLRRATAKDAAVRGGAATASVATPLVARTVLP